jgi:hypothetical protein
MHAALLFCYCAVLISPSSAKGDQGGRETLELVDVKPFEACLQLAKECHELDEETGKCHTLATGCMHAAKVMFVECPAACAAVASSAAEVRAVFITVFRWGRVGSKYDGGARVLLIAAHVHLPTFRWFVSTSS